MISIIKNYDEVILFPHRQNAHHDNESHRNMIQPLDIKQDQATQMHCLES